MGFYGASVNGVYMLVGCGGLGAHRVRVVAGRGADSDSLVPHGLIKWSKKTKNQGRRRYSARFAGTFACRAKHAPWGTPQHQRRALAADCPTGGRPIYP
jgi:hypothetical protein